LESVIRRLDVVITTRMHGLVLALKNGIPALAVDPIAGGAKVRAQAAAWGWPAVVIVDSLTDARLDQWWDWCRSTECAVLVAHCRHEATLGTLVPRLLQEITTP
jgi:hypothetical protein